MEDIILISQLNDFIFCPVSIYFHNLYGAKDKMLFQKAAQINGTAAHEKVDSNAYTTSQNILMGTDVYCDSLRLLGKIDTFDIRRGLLRERKKKIKVIYDGYIFQVYSQCLALREMGYEVKEIQLYSYEGNSIAQLIVYNKILNERNALAKIRNKTQDVIEGIELLDTYINNLKFESLELNKIMGIEGMAAKVYFARIFNRIDWNGRKPRIKIDYINSLLDIGYSILFSF